MRGIIRAAVVLSLLSASTGVDAQPVAVTAANQGMGYGGGFGPWGQMGVSSAGLDAANIISARGQAFLNRSAGMVNLSQARAQEIQNKLDRTQNYFEGKEINQQYEAEQKAKTYVAPDRIVKFNEKLLPKRMSPSQLDPITGKIHWPELLQVADFDPYRKQLDDLFQHRSDSAGGIGSEKYFMVNRVTKEMAEELRKHITQLDAAEYTYCRNFINSLAFEAGHNPQ